MDDKVFRYSMKAIIIQNGKLLVESCDYGGGRLNLSIFMANLQSLKKIFFEGAGDVSRLFFWLKSGCGFNALLLLLFVLWSECFCYHYV